MRIRPVLTLRKVTLLRKQRIIEVCNSTLLDFRTCIKQNWQDKGSIEQVSVVVKGYSTSDFHQDAVFGVQVYPEIDIDENVVMSHKKFIEPLIADFLARRPHPLRIQLLKGSIDQYSQLLQNTDAVVAIEIIEHLYPDVLENVPYNIFGRIQPKIAIFSTPNADFNVLFKPLPNGFRHLDHKFEWSREQFNDWATNICERFPNYVVTFFGVGSDPDNNPEIGPVSQFALFVRKDILNIPLVTEIEDYHVDTYLYNELYEEIHTVDYPFEIDARTDEQKMYDEAVYFMNSFRLRIFNNDPDLYVVRIPLEGITGSISSVTATLGEVRELLLSKGYIIEDECVVLPEDLLVEKNYDGSDSERSCDFYDETFRDELEVENDENCTSNSVYIEEPYEEEMWD